MADIRERLARAAREAKDPAGRAWAAKRLAELDAQAAPAAPSKPPPPVALEEDLFTRAKNFGTKTAETVGAVASDVLDTVSGGLYRRARDFVGDKIAPNAMAATRAAERRAKATTVLDLPNVIAPIPFTDKKVNLGGPVTVGDFSEKAGYFSPVGLPGVANKAGQAVVKKLPQALGKSAPGRVAQQGVAGGVAGGVQGGAEAAVQGADGGDFVDWATKTGVAAALGLGFGTVAGGAAESGGTVARTIRNSKGKTGEDIRLLESHGAEPSPVPFRAVKNAPSERLGVNATSEGRGELGERAGRALTDEVGAQARANSSRFRSEMDAATGRQGERSISVEELIRRVDERLADPRIDLQAGLRAKLENTKKILEGQVEPTMDIYTSRPSEARGRADVVEETLERPVEIYTGTPEEVGTGDASVFIRRKGTPEVTYDATGKRIVDNPEIVAPRSRFLSEDGRDSVVRGRAVTFDPGEPTVIRSTERPGFESRATQVDAPDEPLRVPTGDVRRRSGDSPNRVMDAGKLNQLRDLLDELAGVESRETGIAKNNLPIYALANEIRGIIKQEAPAMALANRRYSDRAKKLERTQERMKTEDEETLGMHIAGLGEEGSKQAGTRKVRLEELREQFPTSDHLTERQVGELFDNPRLLLAEERLKLKKIPRISSGGDDVWNLLEPFLGRLLYPGANAASYLRGTPPVLPMALEDELYAPAPRRK